MGSDDRTILDQPAAPPRPPAPPPSGGSSSRLPWIVAGVGVLIIAVVTVVLKLTVFSSSSSDTASSTYRTHFDGVLTPLIASNESLSGGLSAIHGRHPAGITALVNSAQSATIAARGGLDALDVPSDATQLAANGRETLTREQAYLAAVAMTLTEPSGPTGAQLTTLAGNLTDALDGITPSGVDWSQSVAGAQTLATWAQGAALGDRHRAERKAAAQRARERRLQQQRQQQSQPSSGGSGSTGAPSGSTNCGGGLFAGPDTSCAFAENVREAYDEAPGASATVDVYSPVTHQTYVMNCAPAGNGITCSGGNNASVTF